MIPDLVVVVPSRGRPSAAAALADAFQTTCTGNTWIMVAYDHGDPYGSAYMDLHAPGARIPVRYTSGPSRSMVAALNGAVALLVDRHPDLFAVGFMGDDHMPRTVGWDVNYVNALRALGTGIVYGDDLLQHENLPTQCAMTADIPRNLGYMAPPVLKHLYVDNFWRDLGREAGCLRYLPDTIVEHMHPFAGKATMTSGHQRVNSQQMYMRDKAAYLQWQGEGHYADAIKIVRNLGSGNNGTDKAPPGA